MQSFSRHALVWMVVTSGLASPCQALPQPQLLTFQDAIRTVLQHHPQVEAARLQAQAADVTAQGMPVLPELSLSVSPSILGYSKDALVVTQEVGGNPQRQARLSIARSQAVQAAFTLERQSQEIRYQATDAFIHLQAAQKAEVAQRQNVELSKRFLDVAQAQFKAGNVPQSNVIRAQIELASADRDLAQATAERSLEQTTLRILMGLPSGSAPLVATELGHSPSLPTQAGPDAALSSRPEIKRAELEVSVGRSNADLARSQAWPTFSVRGFVDDQHNIPGTAGLAVGVQVLPLAYQTLPKQIEAADLSVQASEHELVAIRQQVVIETQTAYQHWQQAHQAAMGFEQGSLSQTERLVGMAQEGFRHGASSYLEVLDAQRTLLTTRLNYIQALENENLAAAEYQLAVGEPVTEDSSR